MAKKYDFSGWATRNDLRCSDGRTIRKDAFKDNDGKTVPLVWMHQHDDPSNVLGHAVLQNRNEGVYAYCYFNESDEAKAAKLRVDNKDINSLSIYAGQLKQVGGDVIHGDIKEVSLVLAGANPGAFIDSLSLYHSDRPIDEDNFEAVLYNDDELILAHEDKDTDEEEKVEEKKEEPEEKKEDKKEMAEEKTVKDIYDEFTEEQKKVVDFIVGQALEMQKESESEKKEEADEAKHSDEGEDEMKYNVFEGNDDNNTLEHMDFSPVFKDAKQYGSLKESFLAHADDYGIENIEYLFPDAKNLNNPPEFIRRPAEWVDVVMDGVHHTPFSRIKSMFADITEDDARARGYIKGNMKKDEVFGLLKRSTSPTTIYKKQKLDRDDIIDITDFDVVSWLKTEMRWMLDEEIARAILIGDGRSQSSDDKISELNVRPIVSDENLYTIKYQFDATNVKDVIKAAVRARKGYRGSGNPVFFTTEDILTELLLLEDLNGHIIYDSLDKLCTTMRVRKIVTVPVMENFTNSNGELIGIIVNLNDYNVGADKGGAINMFDDFDIDYNQQKYLIETRISGALIKPFSAIALFHQTDAH